MQRKATCAQKLIFDGLKERLTEAPFGPIKKRFCEKCLEWNAGIAAKKVMSYELQFTKNNLFVEMDSSPSLPIAN